MSCKQLATLSAYAVLLVLLLNVSFTTAASSDSALTASTDESKSYFGYQPEPKDSYKKLVEDLTEFASTYSGEWTRLWDRIDALYKKLYHRKDKDNAGYNYRQLQKMQDLLSAQKATIESLRSERLKAPLV